MLALTLDIAVLTLLLVVLAAGFRLRGALKSFRADSAQLQPLIDSLDKAAGRAETALFGLKQMAEGIGGQLSEEAAGAQRLIDELDFMTKRADQLAERLEGGISQARSTPARPAATADEWAPPPKPAAAVKPAAAEPRRRPPDLEQRLRNLR
jgi:hypothetical protein